MRVSRQGVATSIGVVLVGAALAAQAPASAPPRTPWGVPDLQGTWSFSTVTPLQRPEGVTKAFLTAAEIAEIERRAATANNDEARGSTPAADVAGAYNDFWWDRGSRVSGARTSLIIDPPNGRFPPYTTAVQRYVDSDAAKTIQRIRAGDLPPTGPEDQDLWDRCLTRGIPIVPGPYNNNIQIIQTPDHIVILHEMIHDARIVPLGPAAEFPATFRQWFGTPHGHWEGDTLVVVTGHISASQEMPFAPQRLHLTSAGMRLTERFSRPAEGTLHYEFTVDDPTTYIRPWTAVLDMAPSEGPIFEYACHEGNHAMVHILAAARAQEKEAASR